VKPKTGDAREVRSGMPAKDSIRGIDAISIGGKTYRILKTTERDAYDPPESTPRRRRLSHPKKKRKKNEEKR